MVWYVNSELNNSQISLIYIEYKDLEKFNLESPMT